MAKNESQLHKKLKSMARSWLKKQGFSVKYEYRINKVESYPDGRLRHQKRYYTVDVYGQRNGSAIVIECDGSKTKRLNGLLDIANSVYIWPYGNVSPIKWQKGLSICPMCGHNTSPQRIITLDTETKRFSQV